MNSTALLLHCCSVNSHTHLSVFEEFYNISPLRLFPLRFRCRSWVKVPISAGIGPAQIKPLPDKSSNQASNQSRNQSINHSVSINKSSTRINQPTKDKLTKSTRPHTNKLAKSTNQCSQPNQSTNQASDQSTIASTIVGCWRRI